jgi:acetyl esterase/lipase
MAAAFLGVSIVGALFTMNALHTPRRPEILAVVGFFPAWFTSELPFHHLAWQALATAVFVWQGALEQPAGWVGLAVTLLSWAGLVVLIRRSAATPTQMDAALRHALGDGYRDHVDPTLAIDSPIPWSKIAMPFGFRDPSVTVVRDLPYTDLGLRAHRLDLYRPADGRSGCPILLFIHGGAWVIGDKREQGLPFMTHLAAHGWVCVTVNHRLSPKATFPDHLLDVKQALRWIRRHGAEYGADPDFVVVSGASAGGHLAALMALTANEPTYQPGFEDVDTSVQGCVLWYGVYDFTNRIRARGKGFLRFIEGRVMKSKLLEVPDAFAAASPMDLVRADAPPALIVQGTNDTLVPAAEARHFAQVLAETSTSPVAYAELIGAQHAFEIFRSVRALRAVHGAARFCDYLHAAVREARRAAS